jgi:D-amino-acid dehydrogenase
MRVVIIGGGLIGLTSAHYLAAAGASVTLLDAAPVAAAGASHANGGLITPSMSEPWNAPGVAWQLLRWLGRADAPLLLRPRALPQSAGWMLRFVRASTPAHYRRNTVKNLRLGMYSVTELRRLRETLALAYHAGTRGTIKLFRDARTLEAADQSKDLAAAHGLAFEALDRAGTLRLEPALAPIESSVVGSLHFPGDETGDAREFCTQLAQRLASGGVDLRYGVRVESWRTGASRAIAAVHTAQGDVDGDIFVVAAGAHSAGLLKPLGLALPVHPVKGYSLSIPLQTWTPSPQVGVVDDALHAAAAPIGQVLRVAGTAEFAGFDSTIHDARVDNLRRLVDAIYPRASRAAREPTAIAWAGLRPMSPDGVPVIGRSVIPNLYVNSGHGHLGWTMAAGSGRLLADLVLGERTGLDADDYSWRRFH